MPQTELTVKSEKKDDRHNKVYQRKLILNLSGFQIPTRGPRSYKLNGSSEIQPTQDQLKRNTTHLFDVYRRRCKIDCCYLGIAGGPGDRLDDQRFSSYVFHRFQLMFIFDRGKPSLIPDEERCLDLLGGREKVHRLMRDIVAEHAKKIRRNYAKLKFRDQVRKLNKEATALAFKRAAEKTRFRKKLDLLFAELEHEFREEFESAVEDANEERSYSGDAVSKSKNNKYRIAERLYLRGVGADSLFNKMRRYVTFATYIDDKEHKRRMEHVSRFGIGATCW